MSPLTLAIYAGWGFMGLGFLFGWAYVAVRAAKGLPPLATEPRPTLPNPVLDVTLHVLTFPCIIVGYVVASVLAFQYFQLGENLDIETASPEQRILIVKVGLIVMVAALLAAVPLALLRYSSHWHDLRLHIIRAPRDLALGLVAYTMLAVPVLIVQVILTSIWPKSHPFIDILREDPDPQFLFITAIAAVVVAPVAEEFLFRVLLQGLLERISSRPGWQLFVDVPSPPPPAGLPEDSLHEASAAPDSVEPSELSSPPYPADPAPQPTALPPAPDVAAHASENPFAAPQAGEAAEQPPTRRTYQRPPAYWPIVISSLVFAAAHIGQGPSPFPLFLFALGLGYVYRCTHRVFPCMVMHFSLNFFSMLQLWQYVNGALG